MKQQGLSERQSRATARLNRGAKHSATASESLPEDKPEPKSQASTGRLHAFCLPSIASWKAD